MKKPSHTRATFIEACLRIHGERFDYSYIPDCIILRETVPIGCRIHGVFDQRAQHHLAGSECKRCSLADRVHSHASRARKLAKWNDPSAKLLTYNRVKVTCHDHGDYIISEWKYRRGNYYCGICRSQDKDEWAKYRDEVRRLTKLQWRHNSKYIRTFDGQINGRFTYHIDHLLSVRDGFEHKLEPWLVAHWCNLGMIPARENWRKGRKSLRSPESLRWVYETMCKGYDDVEIK